jgi:hypothetical protein
MHQPSVMPLFPTFARAATKPPVKKKHGVTLPQLKAGVRVVAATSTRVITRTRKRTEMVTVDSIALRVATNSAGADVILASALSIPRTSFTKAG